MRQFIKLAFGFLLLLGLLVSAQEDSAAVSSAGDASSVEPTPTDVPVDVTSPVVTPTPSEEPVVPVPGTESPSDQGPVDTPSSVAGEVSISAQSSPLVSSSDLVEASATSADESSATDASASATPTEGEDDGEAEEYDFEAREVTPLESRPDVVTQDELLAEAEANLPVMEIPEEDAREIAALEASMFEHFVRNDPVINPEDNITLPESVSNCELGLGKRDMAGGWSGQSNSRRWATDGIVMQQSAMGTPASTFVHEVGHWLGLRHTFGNKVDDGETDCLVGDGLRRTTHTRGDRSVIFECQQLPCNEERGVMRIPNFMSMQRQIEFRMNPPQRPAATQQAVIRKGDQGMETTITAAGLAS
ncbi:predicted protein [Verticillium alfalfae VaMs.102]|uniref:Predicted protein n=1 Tax=Verticillium alfalfae (strain VaMs.102 / ATCC MYA-4576 / FGSC 10136) TaxID=526221 RepID=C9SRY3_VERA1|nr:predicted protein [Verticillium alfalfae VaMs.102]EEY21548.1 predicted protein [Verticillium alfalfae VaMs.102]